MKSDFHDVLLKSKRKVVIHEAYNDKMILDVVCPGDLLFFDDCLYS